MGAFETLVATMAEMNVFRLFFPWLLVLAVTYGILDKYEVFEEDAVNGTVALATAFIAIGGFAVFVPAGLFTNFGAALGFIVFALLGVIVVMAMSGQDPTDIGEDEDSLVMQLGIPMIIVAIIGVLWAQLDLEKWIDMAGGTFEDVVMPVLILVFLLLVIAVVSDSGEDD